MEEKKMYNYFLLIGKVSEKPVVEELKDGKRKCVIKLSVARSFMDYRSEERRVGKECL